MNENILNIYLEEIGASALLSAEDEGRLSARILQGDERALNRLIEANLRFVVALARQYQGQGLSMDDLVSEGNLGLMKAARKYDATRGLRFAAYAAPHIRQQIERAVQKEGAEQRVESGKDGRSRSVDAPLSAKPNLSLLSVLADESITATDSDIQQAHDATAVARALGALTDERERQVIKACYGIGQEQLTMAEIAEDMGLRRERVRQIRDRALRRMKIKH